MNLFPCLCSVVFVGISGFCTWKFFNLKEKIYQMKLAETVTIQSLQESAAEIAAEIGPGGFNQFCEIKGALRSDKPLQGELSGQPCAYYETSVTRRWEERYEEYDAQAKRTVSKTRSGSEVVSSNKRQTTCEVDDTTGRLELRLDGADIDLIQSFSSFEPGERPSGNLQIAGFSLNIGIGSGGGRRTLGYEYTERLLPLDTAVYVLGEVRDSEGGLSMRKPDDPKQKFFVTTKSEEELLREAANSQKMVLIGAILCGVLALLSFVAQIIVSLGDLAGR